MLRYLAAIAFLWFSGFGSVSASQDDEAFDPASVNSAVNLFGKTFMHGAAPWVTSLEGVMTEVNPKRTQQGSFFALEYYPVGQSQENWDNIFAITAVKLVTKVSFDIVLPNILKPIDTMCLNPSKTELEKTEKIALVQVVCPELNPATLSKIKEPSGEVALFLYLLDEDVLIGHYMEWRGEPFDLGKRNSWPVGKKDLEKAIAQLKNARTADVGFE